MAVRVGGMDVRRPDRPQVSAYWAALRERPSYAAGVASHQHPLVIQATADIVDLKETDALFRSVMAGA